MLTKSQKYISTDLITKQLSSIKAFMTHGPDDIPNWILKGFIRYDGFIYLFFNQHVTLCTTAATHTEVCEYYTYT